MFVLVPIFEDTKMGSLLFETHVTRMEIFLNSYHYIV